ncbi:transporter substrate-binding domain-containing protein [Kiloniella laminariae]|uniref:Transporter substrate-binding domain-containing protein n=1 Tax=Kiloniella laminariae TaxID=454162 RepID=A0ABT4LF34_9PROT|nr:transporter substrate-binding domain-containing protein [Kiloniella laminariae]MCZ4279709.1 transporter substrate-binding domain-containing protein [Kiloniella laminariae]
MIAKANFTLVFGFLSSTLLFWAAPFPAQSTPENCPEIKINGAADWYPVIMRKETDGNSQEGIQGLAPDITREISRRLGIPLKITPKSTWNRVLSQLEKGELDMLLGAYWTPERAQIYSYTKPVTTDEVAIFVRKGDEASYKELGDLVGRKGLRPMGGSYGKDFDQFASRHLSILEVPTENLIEMLAAGRADYVVLARYDGIADVHETENTKNITPLSWNIASNDVYFMISKASPCHALLEDINRIILELHDEGFIKNLEARYAYFN